MSVILNHCSRDNIVLPPKNLELKFWYFFKQERIWSILVVGAHRILKGWETLYYVLGSTLPSQNHDVIK